MNITDPMILVVEDNEQLGTLYCKVLSHIGLQTLQTTSVKDTLDCLATIVPDIILLDMNMSDGTGRAVIDFLRMNAQFEDTEIVIASGASQYRHYAEEQGIDHFFQKPISVPMLVEFMRRLLGKRLPAPLSVGPLPY
jgi:DNA-binding response OmpR family regulator